MLKRIFVLATLLVTLPMLAQAATWKMTTWAQSQGGTITSRNMTGQDVSKGSVFGTYSAAAAAQTVTVNADTADSFKITKVVKNGIVQTLSTNQTTWSGSVHTVGSIANQSVYATFARISYTLSATASPGGTVTPASQGAYGGVQNPAKCFLLVPSSGKYVSNVTVSAGTEGSDWQLVDAVTGAPATVATLANFAGRKLKLNIVNVSGDTAIAVTFGVTGANAGSTQTAIVNTLVTLDGTASTPASGTYKWSVVQVPAHTPTVTVPSVNGSTAAQPTFTPSVAGTYRFKLVYNGQTLKPAYVYVYVTANVAAGARTQCQNCHQQQGVGGTVFADWSGSVHKQNKAMCYDCHDGANSGGHPGTPQCTSCHVTLTYTTFNNPNNTCQNAGCHTGGIHALQSTGQNVSTCATCHAPGSGHAVATDDCIACHAVAKSHLGNVVNDNSGVRAITPEFLDATNGGTRNSHHVTGVTLANGHCAVCHMEGKVVSGNVVVDTTYHMADATTHLRNCNTSIQSNAAQYVWDPATPNHTAMDQFCMSCHNADGAKSVPAAIFTAVGGGASATNPFGDTISNGYDQMSRSAVVPVFNQFSTGNASHHAVRGKKYSVRTRTAAGRQHLEPVLRRCGQSEYQHQ